MMLAIENNVENIPSTRVVESIPGIASRATEALTKTVAWNVSSLRRHFNAP